MKTKPVAQNSRLVASAKSRQMFAPVLLLAVLLILFWRSFLPDFVHFSNDGPLGVQNSAWLHLPQAMTGQWYDLNSLGANAGAFAPGFTSLIRWLLGAVGYAKFLAPVALWILGMSAWFFFRQLKLAPLAAILGGLAAMLTTTSFSDACWGVASHEIAIGMDFCALGLFAANSPQTPALVRWARLALAGLAVGVNIMEAADIGALLSVFVALFVLFKSVTEESGAIALKIGRGIARVAVIALFAGFIAAQTVIALVSTSITGISGTGQDAASKMKQWDFATQWSLPKKETLGLFVPGLFGYRMDTPQNMLPALQGAYKAGNYWGGIGRTPEIDRFFDKIFQPGDVIAINFSAENPNQNQNQTVTIGADGNINLPSLGSFQAAGMSGFKLKETIDQSYAAKAVPAAVESPAGIMRFSGTGEYVGILAALIAAWAIAQSFRRQNSVFTLPQRKFIWLGAILLIGSLLLAWGRFAPFYQFLYALPYASTVRNPAKFLIVFSWVTVMLFGYGVHGLNRLYLQPVSTPPPPFKNWWSRVRGFDRRWTQFSILGVICSVLAVLVFISEKAQFIDYLKNVGFGQQEFAGEIAAFSIGQAVWLILFFALSAGLLILVVAGFFSGRRARLGGILLGALLVVDMGRANLPWIIHWDYKQKYEIGSLNPVVGFLAEKPFEHRVAVLPFPVPDQFQLFGELYGIEWMQHLFPYYNVQSLDKVQMPREPADLEAFELTVPPAPHSSSQFELVRRNWELTNTRYLLGPAGYLDAMNGALDPVQHRFQIAQRFSIVLKPGVEQFHQRLEELTAVENPTGEYALFEFTGALPRAKLYTDWQSNSTTELSNFTTNGLGAGDLYVLAEAGTNGFLTLKKLASPAFDPEKTVLIDRPLPGANSTDATNQDSAAVEFKSYAPKQIVLSANAAAPSVLLLNDKFDPNWKAFVDGQPAPIFHANFIMRGVFLAPGAHTVEFRFTLPSKPLCFTVAAIATAVFLISLLFFLQRKSPSPEKKYPQ